MFSLKRLFAAAVVFPVITIAGSVASGQYTFTKAFSFGPFFAVNGPAINDQGQVAVSANVDNVSGYVLRGTAAGNPPTTIAEPGDVVTRIPLQPSMNEAGQVVLQTHGWSPPPVQFSILRGDGGPLATIAAARVPSDPFESVGIFPSTNDSGVVAFSGFSREDSSLGVFVNDGGTINPIWLSTSSQFEYPAGDVKLSLNNNGQIAFNAALDNGQSRVFRDDGGSTFTDITHSVPGRENLTIDSVLLNNSGRVAFSGHTEDASGNVEYFLYLGDGSGPPSLLADTTSGTLAAIDAVSLNDNGQVAYYGSVAIPGQPFLFRWSIFAGPDPIMDRVIGMGDPWMARPLPTSAYMREVNFSIT